MRKTILSLAVALSTLIGSYSYGQCTTDQSFSGGDNRQRAITSTDSTGQSFVAGQSGAIYNVTLSMVATNPGCSLDNQVKISILDIEDNGNGTLTSSTEIASQVFTVGANFTQQDVQFEFDSPALITAGEKYMIQATLPSGQDCQGIEPNLAWIYAFPTTYWQSTGGTQYWGTTTPSLGNTQKFSTCVGTPVTVSSESLSYHANATGGAPQQVTLGDFSTCQEKVELVIYHDIYTGVWTGAGNYTYYVNGSMVGSGTEINPTIDISAYIPVTSVQVVSNAGTWSVLDVAVKVYGENDPSAAPTVASPVNYFLDDVASPLEATLTGSGTTLKWYTSEAGDGYSATAPTPNTAVADTISYWVAEADASGCESERAEIQVIVTPKSLSYHANATGGAPQQVTFDALSSCQSKVEMVIYHDIYTGVWTGAGNYTYYVNGSMVGSGTEINPTIDISAYIPVTSVQVVSNAGTWSVLDVTVNVTNTVNPVDGPSVSSPVNYVVGDAASPLEATFTGSGTTLKWYTTAVGDGYSATAPTPLTSTVDTVSYWVAQADASGCESERVKIDVITNPHSLSYHANATGGAPQQVTFDALSSCQSKVEMVIYHDIYTGVWTGAGNYTYYVNGTSVGSGTEINPTIDISAYIPVTSVQVVSNAGTWSVLDVTVNVLNNSAPEGAPTTSDVMYSVGDIASPLDAILTGSGTTLKWYTSAVGDGYSATALTPNTSTEDTLSYWVSQADGSGCESKRTVIEVIVETVTGTSVFAENEVCVFPNPVSGVLNINNFEEGDVIVITNLNGQVELTGSESSISTSALTEGIHMFELTREGQVIAQGKLIKH